MKGDAHAARQVIGFTFVAFAGVGAFLPFILFDGLNGDSPIQPRFLRLVVHLIHLPLCALGYVLLHRDTKWSTRHAVDLAVFLAYSALRSHIALSAYRLEATSRW